MLAGVTDFISNFTVPAPAASSGSIITDSLVYLRCNYTFTYVSNSGNEPVALVSATAVMADAIGTPKQGHISLTANTDEIIVSFTSGTNNVPSVRCVVFCHQSINQCIIFTAIMQVWEQPE